jgi:hypothetical protein
MKGKLIAFASILCIASLMVSGANADKPEKPGHKDHGTTQTEWIFFMGDLTGGSAPVEGCCPNAGPYPEYTLTFSDAVNFPDGTYDGQLFMNGYRIGRDDRGYKVQFWTPEGVDHICFEIYGGVRDYEKKTKVLTVTFTAAEWNFMGERGIPQGEVSFVLTRSPM